MFVWNGMLNVPETRLLDGHVVKYEYNFILKPFMYLEREFFSSFTLYLAGKVNSNM